MTDPIADMLNRIKNAQIVFHKTIDVPFSNFKYELGKILEREGFINKIEKKGKGAKKILKIDLKYEKDALNNDINERPAISGVRKISKPGQRIYSDSRKLKTFKKGSGIIIVSTSKGLMTDKEARIHKLGGEIICEIW